jgi:hypothetical protein
MLIFNSFKSTNMSNTTQLAAFLCELNMQFNITEELAALKPVQWASTDAYLCEAKKLLQSLVILKQKLAGLVTDGVPKETVACLCLSPMM